MSIECQEQVGEVICGKQFKRDYFLHKHKLDCHGIAPPSNYKTYSCPHSGCPVVKSGQEEIDNHCVRKHGKVAYCPKGCKQIFASVTYARIHGKRCNGEGIPRKLKEKKRQCMTCGKVFRMGRILKQHLADGICGQKEGSVEKVPCTICDKLFVYHRNMLMHVKKSHPELYQRKERRKKKEITLEVEGSVDLIECEVDIKCEVEDDYQIEEEEEDKERDICEVEDDDQIEEEEEQDTERDINFDFRKQCMTCGKVFRLGRILKQHLTDGICGQKKGSVAKVPCTICDKLFGYHRNMLMHVKKFHPEFYQRKERGKKKELTLKVGGAVDLIKCEVDIKYEVENDDQIEEEDTERDINFDFVDCKIEADYDIDCNNI